MESEVIRGLGSIPMEVTFFPGLFCFASDVNIGIIANFV